MNNILLLGSQSQSRRTLLTQTNIPFVQLEQQANEHECDWLLPLSQLVESIAKHKMDSLILPKPLHENQEIFVLTADTLTEDFQTMILGKPLSAYDARDMIKKLRKGARVGTAFCLDRKQYSFERWNLKERIIGYAQAQCVVDIPDEYIERYLQKSHALHCSGSMAIDGYGAQFLKTINGSYSAVLGLPLSELRNALEKIGFF